MNSYRVFCTCELMCLHKLLTLISWGYIALAITHAYLLIACVYRWVLPLSNNLRVVSHAFIYCVIHTSFMSLFVVSVALLCCAPVIRYLSSTDAWYESLSPVYRWLLFTMFFISISYVFNSVLERAWLSMERHWLWFLLRYVSSSQSYACSIRAMRLLRSFPYRNSCPLTRAFFIYVFDVIYDCYYLRWLLSLWWRLPILGFLQWWIR